MYLLQIVKIPSLCPFVPLDMPMSHIYPLLAVITDAVIVLNTPNQISMYFIKFDNKHYYYYYYILIKLCYIIGIMGCTLEMITYAN